MKDYPVGKVFFHRFRFLKVVEMKSCMECAFVASLSNCGCELYSCLKTKREDNKDVVFAPSSLKEYIKYKRRKK